MSNKYDKMDEVIDHLIKGGAGSGKKGHTTQKDLEGLKNQMGRHHIMQYGDKGSAFSESGKQGKSEVFHHEPTNSYHVVTEGGGVNELKDHPNFKRLGAPYKGDPAAEGNKASRQDASGTRDFKGPAESKSNKYQGNPAEEGNRASREDASGTRDMKKSLETLFYMKQLAEEGRIKPKKKRNIRKADEKLEKKQGVPKGVDPAKHERCVMDVKASGKDKSSAFAICNSSMNKGGVGSGKKGHTSLNQSEYTNKMKRLTTIYGEPQATGDNNFSTHTFHDSEENEKIELMRAPGEYHLKISEMNKSEETLEKFLAGAALKTGARIVQNLVKPASSKGGEKADQVSGTGLKGGPSVAAGGGTGKQDKGPGKKMSKSLFDRLFEKGGIGSGRKGHHTIGQDYSDEDHDSVFEDNQFDNIGEREAYKDKMIAAAQREEEKALQRIKEKESSAVRGVSRKTHGAPEKKSFLQRMGQKLIDII